MLASVSKSPKQQLILSRWLSKAAKERQRKKPFPVIKEVRLLRMISKWVHFISVLY